MDVAQHQQQKKKEDVCQVCLGEEKGQDVLDGLCDACEPLWLDCIERLTCVVPGETAISNMFKRANIAARYQYVKRKNAIAVAEAQKKVHPRQKQEEEA